MKRLLRTTGWIAMTALLMSGMAWSFGAQPAKADDFIVYSIYKGLDLGNADETPEKDFYVNLGSAQGIKTGSSIEVLRRTATYDLTNQKLYKEISFPIATLKVIHVERNAAVARMVKMYSADTTPVMTPRAVMVGDFVRPLN
ncbi:MAG: hypothetical protein H7222_17765 [Methylotenera sp.]|nr:hypothetical protein [Oligoflexia bacterium]